MKTSAQGVGFLAAHEGIVPAPYLDSVGVWTYGIGHTAAAGKPYPKNMPRGFPADLDQAVIDAVRVFARDLVAYETAVAQAIRVPVTQAQFDAAVSFHFNTGAIARASWVESLNKGNITLAGQQFMNWSKPLEIVPRREAEQRLFLTGDYGNTRATIWGVNDQGRLTWKSHGTIDQAELASMVGRGVAPAAQQPLTFWERLLAWLQSWKP